MISAHPVWLLVVAATCGWAGVTLLLSLLPHLDAVPLAKRLGPFTRAGAARPTAGPATLRELVLPALRAAAARVASVLGVEEDVSIRLHRIHAPIDAAELRLRQLRFAALGGGLALVLAGIARPPIVVAGGATLGSALLGFLVVEQQLATASERWQQRIALELPVVCEQLGMLLGAGYSLGTALNRLAERGSGSCAQDLARVCGRIRQGLDEREALQEWAEVARVDALSRLVSVLALHREAGDLSQLITQEARNVRRDAQRRLVEQIERRAQQVWIPVTVATLVPGAVLLAIPFVDALRLFSST